MMTDPIADMISRINNALENRAQTVKMPFSNMKASILKVLQQDGYVNGYQAEADKNKTGREIIVQLKYYRDQPAIKMIKRLSKPGRRLYSSYAKIPRPLNGLGAIVVSTPQGVMNNREARKSRQGGELICEVN